ncbi:MAG TPA: hypothetical protein VFV07_10820 [Rhizomicrobium sp.]|nr:hypothetical protein [Rhizomicrobium sp.]
MNFLESIWAMLKADALSIWSRVSATFNTLLGELPDDEINIFHGAQTTFTGALQAGKGWGDAVAETWTYVENQEGAELSKVANLLLQAFMAKFETPSS